jgi:signal transduction histidine kinase
VANVSKMSRAARSRGLLTAFLMVLATLVVTAALACFNLQRLYEHDRLVDQTRETIAELRLLLATIADAEAATRGYIVTFNAEYLKANQSATVTIPVILDRIERLTARNRLEQGAMQELRQQLNWRTEQMDDAIQSVREHGSPTDDRLMTAHGPAASQQVRELIRAIERQQAKVLSERVGEASVAYWTAVVSSVISAVLGLTLAGLGFVFTSRDIQLREQRTTELAELNEWLEDRVCERTAALSEANAALRAEIAERQKAEHTARLAAEQLEHSNRELEQFASIASHDLQEPLRKIEAFGDRLLGQYGESLTQHAREYLDRMLDSVARMRALIDGLLEYSRVATRQQPLVPVDLGRIAREVVGDLESRLATTDGNVEIGELPTVTADPLQMRQLLQNLIANALKFQREGATPHVRLWSQFLPDNACWELAVEDNGIGFDPQYGEQIFELFQRYHGHDEYQGSGMGLAICKKIAQRHGGSIRAESSPGQGSRFTVALPAGSNQSVAAA